MNLERYIGGTIMNKDDFEFDIEKSKITKMLKIAKRKQLTKIIIISTLSSILVLILLFLGVSKLNDLVYWNVRNDTTLLKDITQPNTEHGEPIIVNSGIFKNTLVYRNYKIIEGHPIKWDDETYEFKIWNTFYKVDSKNFVTIENNKGVSERSSQSNDIYNPQTMERAMQFYLPFVSYPKYMNDLAKLKSDNMAAEMAISFDKPYTVSEINKMLPDGVHPVWYWVDTYYNKKQYDVSFITESANDVYGFRKQGAFSRGNGTEESFLLYLKDGLKMKGKYYNEYKRIYDYLRGEKKEPDTKDVRIFGVVVTGTKANLQKLENAPYMKAAVLGATVEEK